MGVVNTTYTFTSTDTITSAKMNNIIDETTFTGDAIQGTTLQVVSPGKLAVSAGGITSNELASNSVTSANIVDASITNAKLATTTGEIGGSWQSYTPVFTLSGGATSGNAVITGRYTKIGKTVHFYITYTLGTTTNFTGLTSMAATIPLGMSASYSDYHPIASVSYVNGSGARSAPGSAVAFPGTSTTTIAIISHAATPVGINYNTTNATNPIPFAADSTNKILICGTYEIA